MLTLSSSSSSSSSSFIYPWKYEIFLSFSGEERTKFADHVYRALIRDEIKTFRDNNYLERGEDIKTSLLEAIEESWGSVIIFSKGYASSSWCLDEVVGIVKQNEERGRQVFPIFYHVEVTDLRHQTNGVAEAFAKHEEKYKDDKEKIQRWRYALSKAADIAGWVPRDHQYESDFIEEVIDKIKIKLSKSRSHWEVLYRKLNSGQDDVRFIGICGTTGQNRTALARVVYAQMSPCFEAKIFLNVGEVSANNGLDSLQKLLLTQISSEETSDFSNIREGSEIISQKLPQKKAFIVMNNVDDIQHLKYIVGKTEWFGQGSKIIITTQNEHLLRSFEVDNGSELTTMDARRVRKIVIKVDMRCAKCRLKALKIVASANGVNYVEIVGENRDRVMVSGDGLDLARLIRSLRKNVGFASVCEGIKLEICKFT